MKKIISGILAVIILIFVVTFSTYAWTTWSTNKKNSPGVIFAITGLDDKISYYVSHVNSPNLIPVLSKTKGYINNINLSQTGTEDLYATFTLNITDLDDGLKDVSFKYELSIGDEIYGNGNFSNHNEGDTITLNSVPIQVTNTSQIISLYIWIDGTLTNPESMQNQNYHFDLRANITNQPN